MYVFAIFGMWQFAGLVSALPESVYDIPGARFDSLSVSLITLFQVGAIHSVVGFAFGFVFVCLLLLRVELSPASMAGWNLLQPDFPLPLCPTSHTHTFV